MVYFICTNENDDFNYYRYDKLKYRSIKYQCKFKTGLNIDKNAIYYLAEQPLAPYSSYIRLVKIPDNTTIINEYCYCVDKIILSDRYYLYDPKTVKKFNLEIDTNYISGACYIGSINFLEWWLKSGLSLKYNEYALDYASGEGHVHVLEWWKNSGLPLKYSESALNSASWKGHINVLKWWKNSGLELKYYEYALDRASGEGHVNVLEWWFKSGLELKYSELALNWASGEGHVHVLEWWLKSGLELKYDERGLNNTSRNGHVHVLEWFINNNFEVSFWYKFEVYYNRIKKRLGFI
jgi:hypothetical protein